MRFLTERRLGDESKASVSGVSWTFRSLRRLRRFPVGGILVYNYPSFTFVQTSWHKSVSRKVGKSTENSCGCKNLMFCFLWKRRFQLANQWQCSQSRPGKGKTSGAKRRSVPNPQMTTKKCTRKINGQNYPSCFICICFLILCDDGGGKRCGDERSRESVAEDLSTVATLGKRGKVLRYADSSEKRPVAK